MGIQVWGFTHPQTSVEAYEVPHEKDVLHRALSPPLFYLRGSVACRLANLVCLRRHTGMNKKIGLGEV